MKREGLSPVLRGGPLLIGHRGAAGLAPENTMPSFRDAVERWDVDMIELDVRASADGHCVVIHDATVDRTTDGTGPVAAKTLAELRELDAGARFRAPDGSAPFAGRGTTIPTIDEVADLPEDPHQSPFDEDAEPIVRKPLLTTPLPGQRPTLREVREAAERSYIVQILNETDWNISRAAVQLGVERTNLHKKIRAYAIARGEST